MLSINEGTNAMHVHFHTKKRQQKIVDSNQKVDVMKGQRKRNRKSMASVFCLEANKLLCYFL